MRKSTKLVHGGRHAAHPPKTVNLPIARASTVLFESLGDLICTHPTGTNVNDLVFLFWAGG